MTLNRLEEIGKIYGITGIEIMQLGESGHSQSNNQNNNYSLINNSTITLPCQFRRNKKYF